MSESSSSSYEEEVIEVVYEAPEETISSENVLPEEWSSLNLELPEVSRKKILYSEGLYDPGSGEICTKYIPQSNSALFRHPLNEFPPVTDPGIEKALLGPPDVIEYSDDGKDLYLATCKEMHICPVSIFTKGLLGDCINLEYYCVSSLGVRAIALALRNNRTVTSLNLTDSFLNYDACFHLGEMLMVNISLNELNLSGCKIGPDGLKCIMSGIIINRPLRVINLDRNQLGDVGGEILAGAIISGIDITHINLSKNEIGPNTLEALVVSFETQNKFEKIDLSWNCLYADFKPVCKFISSFSENDYLTEINLSWNGLTGVKVGSAISKLLLAPNLTRLNLSNNMFRDDDIIFTNKLKNATNLLSLDLSYNPLTAVGSLKLMTKMVLTDINIEELLLDSIDVNARFMDLLEEVLELRPNVTVTHGRVIKPFVAQGPDMRDLILNRIEFLLKPPKKKRKLDIILIALKQLKEGVEVMPVKNFMTLIKKLGGKLDEGICNGLAEVFYGGKKGKVPLINFNLLAEFGKRKWPERVLLPTPPPQPERKARGKKKTRGTKRKGKSKEIKLKSPQTKKQGKATSLKRRRQ